MKVHIVEPCDDWVGVYINAKLVYENHSVSGSQMLDFIANHSDKTPVERYFWSYDDYANVDNRAEQDGEVIYNGSVILSGWKCPPRLELIEK